MEEWKKLPGVHNGKELYRFLVQRYILEKTKLDRIDEKMRTYEISFIPCPPEERNAYHAHDFMGLEYIYVRNDIHMERLSEEQVKILEHAAMHLFDEASVADAMKIVLDTYKEVLAFSLTSGIKVELFPSVSGNGIVPGDALVFVLAAIPDYDESGNVRDWEKERKKKNVLFSLKEQLTPICEKALEMPVFFGLWEDGFYEG